MSKHSFPVRIVAQGNTENGTWIGRRGSGTIVGRGVYRFEGNNSAGSQFVVFEDSESRFSMTAQLSENALRQLFSRLKDDSSFPDILERLTSKELSIVYIEGHEYLLEMDSSASILTIACDWLNSLTVPVAEDRQGFEFLLILGHCHLLLCWLGWTQRQAFAKVVELYMSFSKGEQALMHRVLEGSVLDSGNLFSIFLKRSTSSPSLDIKNFKHLEWLDQQVTWLLGQDRADLPYSREAALDILQSETDIDEQRSRLYRLLWGYDKSLERRNIERISTEVQEASQQLIFGRMSRAFHNQATLFANAVLLQPGLTWPQLSTELYAIADVNPSLQPSAGTLGLLLNSSAEIPMINLEGACERFEDAVLEAQKKALSNVLVLSRLRVENFDDPLAEQSGSDVSREAIMAFAEQGLGLIERIRQAFLGATKRHAAYVVISQRPSPTGSHLLIKINELQDPYSGKAENLRKLVRLAGDRIYSSPDYGWLEVADHWIEAIPLFIKEEVLVQDGEETTRTVIDISGMEVSFREEMADLWATNLRQVIQSELLCLAREYLAAMNISVRDEESACQEFEPDEVAAVGLFLGEIYRRQVVQVQKLIESKDLEPFEALHLILLDSDLMKQLEAHHRITGSWTLAVKQVLKIIGFSKNFDREFLSFSAKALKPRRQLPALHVLTTQSAGMTEGYIRTWLEESMALFNIAEDLELHEQIAEREKLFATRIVNLGEKLIRELGIWIEIEELCAQEQVSQPAAVLRLINRNRMLQEEVSCLGALLEFEELKQGREKAEECSDPVAVEDYLGQHSEALQESALIQVIERNRETLMSQMPVDHSDDSLRNIVLEDEYYCQDLQTYGRFIARRRVLEHLNSTQPQLHLLEACKTYLRRFQQLQKTTARKEIIAELGLNHLTLHPLYYFKASGGGKRYHLIYTPSRVDLGHRERESVETWSQWVGGADRAATRAGRQIYSLINKDVRAFESLIEPEILKTGENASMVSHFGFSNALSMMVTASAHGDFEAMADLMNRRSDRLVHPAGEGYGGYCVPKDGLFLEFVLTLNRVEKLRQIGLPEIHHQAAVALANLLLDRKLEFFSQLEWEEWAGCQLQSKEFLRAYFTINRGLPVFQITRIAHVLENLGQPELRDSYRVASSMAASWGLHKLVTGGEQVNRFMPFLKAWLIRQALEEAARRHPSLQIAIENSVIVLTAEYKPDTQDARFATGLRKFEILSGTGGHLLNALDLDGRIVAVLMHEGFAGLQRHGWIGRFWKMMNINADDNLAFQQMRQLFPEPRPPAELRLVSPMGLSTQDLLNYTSDTRLEAIANETRNDLIASGLTVKEIEANLRTWGTRLNQWDHRLVFDPLLKTQLQERLSGGIHALALATLGAERHYEHAVQGADVLDTGIPHSSLLDLLAAPAYLCRLMLAGNLNSALVIVDGAAGARHRAMNRGDVMLWFAAAERLGRESVYHSVGMGRETVEAWRADMRRMKRRAEQLWQAITGNEPQAVREVYQHLINEMNQNQEIQSALAETDKLTRFGRSCERDLLLCKALNRIGSGADFESLSFADFLALGGLYLFVGATEAEVAIARDAFTSNNVLAGNSTEQDERLIYLCLGINHKSKVAEFRQEKGIESSNKAMEDRPTVALATRRQLAERIIKASSLNLRHAGFATVKADSGDFFENYSNAMQILGQGDHPVTEEGFGTFLGFAQNALIALAREFGNEEHPEETQGMISRLKQLFSGLEFDEQVYQSIAGGYEDIGDFGRMAQAIRERRQQGEISVEVMEHQLGCVAQGAELFAIILAIESTITFSHQQPLDIDVIVLWRSLSGFFAKTLNDHSYEYRPWAYSRGTGYLDYQGESLYRLAVERHQWLYRYLRFVITDYSDLRKLTVQEQDLLLGNYLEGKEVEAIGAGGDGEAEKIWRSYGQLRELAFIRNDGFPVPDVFGEFDPAFINDRSRVNHVLAVPVGRTHFSRVLSEGPTLARQLAEEGRRGSNLIITRKIDVIEDSEYARPVAQISSGHFYLDAATYEDALVALKGYSRQEAAQQSSQRFHPKGIRVAARFTRPVLAALIYPFHGDPVYNSGKLDVCGLPYTVQSLFHTWTTYDKAMYRDIYCASGVEMPDEIAWLADYTIRSSDKAEVKNWLLNGLEGTDYQGLQAFAGRYPLVMIKDAAESGGRNAQAFVLGRLDGSLDTEQIQLAVEFIYQISLKHNVCIQEVILSSPEHWATEAFMRDFVRRQIVEWGGAVNRQCQPHTTIFGSHRIILSTDNTSEVDLEKKWHISHWITLNSKQLITNVGRGGTLELLLPEYIRPEHRQTIFVKLAEAGRRVMEAMAAYEGQGSATYSQATGREVGIDLMGVSYGMPRYLMLDFLIAPLFDQAGVLVEIEPIFDENRCRLGSRFILQEGSRRFPATIIDWRVVLIEPNIGVGLWDRVALREEQHELERSCRLGISPDWDRVGENARIVLKDLNRAGEDYLDELAAKNDFLP